MKHTAEYRYVGPEMPETPSIGAVNGALAFPEAPGPMTVRFPGLSGSGTRAGVEADEETMHAVRRLAGRVAHHMNNLLTVVGVNAEHLEAELSGRGFDSELGDIRDACGRAAEVSSKLLALSACNWSHPSIVDLRSHVLDMNLGRFFSGDVVFCTEWGDVKCPVNVDPAQLEDAVTELVLNARDALHGGGTVRVGIDYLPGTKLRSTPSAGWVQLEVSDSGQGMDRATLSKAFHPFFSTRPSAQHMGLGLSVAHGIVRRSGGVMQVFSTPGRGTTVRVWLPAMASVSKRRGAPSHASEG